MNFLKLNIEFGIFYFILWASLIILGPEWYLKYPFVNKINKINILDVVKRLFFITYVGLLLISYYYFYPTFQNYINLLVVNILSILGFHIYKGNKLGTIAHVIYLIPPIVDGLLRFKRSDYIFKPNLLEYILIVYLISIFIFKKKIYKVIHD